jgi:hypothetical protein
VNKPPKRRKEKVMEDRSSPPGCGETATAREIRTLIKQRDQILNVPQPERHAGVSDEQWQAFLRGWKAHADEARKVLQELDMVS